MDSNGGWIKVHRKLQDSWIWDFDNPKMAMAWIDLLMSVNHSDKVIMVDAKPFTVRRGSRYTSISKLAEKWRVTRKTASKWLKTFESCGMVSTQVYSKGTLINVEKYSDYQDGGNDEYSGKYSGKYPTHYPTEYPTHYSQDKNDKECKEGEEGKGSLASLSSSLVSYLNEKVGSHYKNDKATERLINHLVSLGYTEADMKTVIDKKVAEWIGSDKMRAFLRPRTLFGDKFREYLSAPEPLQVEQERKGKEDRARLMMEKVRLQDSLDGVLHDIRTVEDGPGGIREHRDQFNALTDQKIELEGAIEAIDKRLGGG